MAALKDRIATDLKDAMKARDQVRVDTLRSALSAFTYKRTEAGTELSDADELDVVRKQVKQRNDSFTEFQKAGRDPQSRLGDEADDGAAQGLGPRESGPPNRHRRTRLKIPH